MNVYASTRSLTSFPLPNPLTGALGLIGLELDPDSNDADATTFTIIDNTATTITIDAADGDLTTVAAVGDSYIGVYTFEDVTIVNGAWMRTADNLIINGFLTIIGGTLDSNNF